MTLVPRPYLPRVLTCLVVGLLLSLAVLIPSREDDGKSRLYITVISSGKTDDIERAIKSLGRSDIELHHGLGGVYLTPFEGWIFLLIFGTVISAFGWAGMSFIYSVIRNALESKAAK